MPVRALPWLLVALLACTPAAASDVPLRLLPRAEGRHDLQVTLGVETRPALDPKVATQTLPLAGAPPSPVLWIGLGLEPGDVPATWRAEAVLVPPTGPPITLLERTLDPTATAWQDHRLALPDTELAGATLTLRATLVGTAQKGMRRVVWGDPMLLPREGPARPSVILVSLDTLRTDRVGPRADGSPSRTPNLDALARESIDFRHAYSPSTWTHPSHLALLWGRHPILVDRVRAQPMRPLEQIGGAMAPLAQSFAEAGWITAAFTGGGWMSPSVGMRPGAGFGRGFDVFRAFTVPTAPPGQCAPGRFDGTTVFDWTTRFIRDNATRPFFLFVHTYEPHDRCPFIPAGDDDIDALASQPERRRELDAYYDDLIARTDALMGRLREVLDATGLASRTILAVTSDHGEALFEHGVGGHGCETPPYEELARVPLLVKPAGSIRAARVDAPVGLVQVAPTLRALAGIPGGPPADGPPLPDLGIAGGAAPATVHVGCGELQGVRAGRHKLIATRDGSRPDELYDLASDPGERTNLVATQPDTRKSLRAAAEAYWGTGPAPPSQRPEVDPKLREQLRALGYAE